MKKKLYQYKNDKVGFFMDPFYLPYDEADVKEFVRQGVMTGNAPANFEELSLYCFGIMDDKSGDFEPLHDFVCSLSEFKQ